LSNVLSKSLHNFCTTSLFLKWGSHGSDCVVVGITTRYTIECTSPLTRRGKNKNLTALKSNSNTVWFNFQTYICIYIYIYKGLGLWCLTPLSTICQLYRGCPSLCLKWDSHGSDCVIVGITTSYTIECTSPLAF
jgi:hypothetical protein